MAKYALGVLLLWLTGCAYHPPVSVDYEPATSFGALKWYDWAAEASAELAAKDGLLDRRIRTAIEQQLRARGYRYKPQAPDFLIDYQVRDVQRLRYRPVYYDDFPMAFPYRFDRFHHHHHVVARPYWQRILTLDVLDREHRLIWRGSYHDDLRRLETPAEREQEIQRQVQAILDQFPPPP